MCKELPYLFHVPVCTMLSVHNAQCVQCPVFTMPSVYMSTAFGVNRPWCVQCSVCTISIMYCTEHYIHGELHLVECTMPGVYTQHMACTLTMCIMPSVYNIQCKPLRYM